MSRDLQHPYRSDALPTIHPESFYPFPTSMASPQERMLGRILYPLYYSRDLSTPRAYSSHCLLLGSLYGSRPRIVVAPTLFSMLPIHTPTGTHANGTTTTGATISNIMTTNIILQKLSIPPSQDKRGRKYTHAYTHTMRYADIVLASPSRIWQVRSTCL